MGPDGNDLPCLGETIDEAKAEARRYNSHIKGHCDSRTDQCHFQKVRVVGDQRDWGFEWKPLDVRCDDNTCKTGCTVEFALQDLRPPPDNMNQWKNGNIPPPKTVIQPKAGARPARTKRSPNDPPSQSNSQSNDDAHNDLTSWAMLTCW
ncbi:hypothetical protein JDV02_007266 [Purpureocillium takamizusanense]|uniref:Uncharacterized protein n=1 Tax=Purpureocillium takamizusanense TaxID=2060973 RepID=A0A9Q8VDK3_9HYPO|nr:uncharacterized protein JDV02_007266 [Purpureocillium takamizusanense]UNI21261.1 hypothetical protein JDV02_007266 [Purpureocillium takamizusanense]